MLFVVENRNIIFNLSKIKTIDNILVEKLIAAQKYWEKRNRAVCLCGISPETLSVFYLLKLDKYFEFYENEKEAFLRKNRLVKRRLKAV